MELLLLDTNLQELALTVLFNALALMGGAYLLRGVYVGEFVQALIVALVLAVLNATLGAVLDFLTTPLRWITLGLFALIVDAIVLLIAARFTKGLRIDGFMSAFFLAILVAIFNAILHGVFL